MTFRCEDRIRAIQSNGPFIISIWRLPGIEFTETPSIIRGGKYSAFCSSWKSNASSASASSHSVRDRLDHRESETNWQTFFYIPGNSGVCAFPDYNSPAGAKCGGKKRYRITKQRISHRPGRFAECLRLRSARNELPRARLGQRPDFSPIAGHGTSCRTDTQGARVRSASAPAPDLHERSSRQRVRPGITKPFRFRREGRENTRRVSDTWNEASPRSSFPGRRARRGRGR